ncbi:MAG: CDP-alcohol phosphatidyltransferase family protein [Verrucomicrobiota bacterium]|nr:CDP-alcohol phosphatidyltransferase family protein [Verrucomicrobiota bacterium]
MTLPNYITIFRILLIPVFVLLVLEYKFSPYEKAGQHLLLLSAFIIFVTAALSDFVDGYLARKFHQVSVLGKILDPIADKGLQFAGLIVLSIPDGRAMSHFPIWFIVLYFTRDILLLIWIVSVNHLGKKVTVQPHWSGKVSTALLMALISYALLNVDWFPFSYGVWAVAIFIFWSLVVYLRVGIKDINEYLSQTDKT